MLSSLMIIGNFSIDESSQAFGRSWQNSFTISSDSASYYGVVLPPDPALYSNPYLWNNGGIGAPDGGDPLLFSLTDKPVNVIRNWSGQHESFLTEFDLYDI